MTNTDTPALIGVGGRLRSGKDAFADHLVAEHGFQKLNMSTPIHELAYGANPIVGYIVEYRRRPGLLGYLTPKLPVVAPQRYAELADGVGYTEAKKDPEVRRLLADIGQIARKVIDPDVWTEIARRSVTEVRESGAGVIITGIRFPQERHMVEQLGGTLVWVERPSLPAEPSAQHVTETSVNADDFHETVVNDGTLQDLWAHARRVAGVSK